MINDVILKKLNVNHGIENYDFEFGVISVIIFIQEAFPV